jgi:hypothetical protein
MLIATRNKSFVSGRSPRSTAPETYAIWMNCGKTSSATIHQLPGTALRTGDSYFADGSIDCTIEIEETLAELRYESRLVLLCGATRE